MPALRNRTMGIKVTDEEHERLERRAEMRGLTMSDWGREVLLAELIAHPAEQIILAEILGLRMLYLNTIQILGAGRELTTDDLRKLIEKVDREKQRKAEGRLGGAAANGQGRKNE
jgi:hypothetical protein